MIVPIRIQIPDEHQLNGDILVVVLQCQRPGLLDQELIDCDILAALLAYSALFDASKWGLGGRLVASVLEVDGVSQGANYSQD